MSQSGKAVSWHFARDASGESEWSSFGTANARSCGFLP
jgi:hypothetical protein